MKATRRMFTALPWPARALVKLALIAAGVWAGLLVLAALAVAAAGHP